ncbi:MAG: CtsR family transcriptional regulator [Bacillota bacterium]|nr:CtsR family transcriptional regulator [Bacillota bacterium]
MYLSNSIEEFLNALLNGGDGAVEIKRNELAERLGCVPSQINYVIQTRFTKERGYTVESRRGGGGFIKITRVRIGADEYIMHIVNNIGDSIDFQTAKVLVSNLVDYQRITKREAMLILAAVSDSSLPFNASIRNQIRSNMLKNILISLT